MRRILRQRPPAGRVANGRQEGSQAGQGRQQVAQGRGRAVATPLHGGGRRGGRRAGERGGHEPAGTRGGEVAHVKTRTVQSPESRAQQLAQGLCIEPRRQVQQLQPVCSQGDSQRQEQRQHPAIRGQERRLPPRPLLLQSGQAVLQRSRLLLRVLLQVTTAQ